MKVAVFVTNQDRDGAAWAIEKFGRSEVVICTPKYFKNPEDVSPYLTYTINERKFKVNEVYTRDRVPVVERAAGLLDIPVNLITETAVPEDAIPVDSWDTLSGLKNSPSAPDAPGDLYGSMLNESTPVVAKTSEAVTPETPNDEPNYRVERRGKWFAVMSKSGEEIEKGFESSDEAEAYIVEMGKETTT